MRTRRDMLSAGDYWTEDLSKVIGFLKELRRRNVFRVAGIYIIVAWLVLQVVDVFMDFMPLPEWTSSLVFVLLLAGFPVAIVLAWAFELTPEGVKPEAGSESRPVRPFGLRDAVLGGALVAILGWWAWDRNAGNLTETETGEIRSLVVLPLDNLMNDEGQAYFVSGMHDALITELSRIRALRVISRTSAMRYLDTDKPLPEIARELGVDAVVEGSVLRAGDTVRINVQLIDARDDRHIWGEQFDRDLGDILALYANVTRRITEQVAVQITDREVSHLAQTPKVDAEVYDLYLQSVALCDRWVPEMMLRGIEQLREVTRRAPDTAMYQASLALCLQYASFFDFIPNLEIRAEALLAAERAVSLDPELPLANVAKGGTHWYLDFNGDAARKYLKRSLDISPAYDRGLIHYSWLTSETGRFEESFITARRAIETDPLNNAAHQALGQAYYLARDFDSAGEAFDKALALDPNDPSYMVYPAWALTQRGQHEEAVTLLRKAVDLSGGHPFHLAEYGLALGLAGRREAALEVLDRLNALEGGMQAAPIHFALLHTGLGNQEEAIDWLERAFEARNSGLFYISFGAQFDGLRDNPRFEALVSRMRDDTG